MGQLQTGSHAFRAFVMTVSDEQMKKKENVAASQNTSSESGQERRENSKAAKKSERNDNASSSHTSSEAEQPAKTKSKKSKPAKAAAQKGKPSSKSLGRGMVSEEEKRIQRAAHEAFMNSEKCSVGHASSSDDDDVPLAARAQKSQSKSEDELVTISGSAGCGVNITFTLTKQEAHTIFLMGLGDKSNLPSLKYFSGASDAPPPDAPKITIHFPPSVTKSHWLTLTLPEAAFATLYTKYIANKYADDEDVLSSDEDSAFEPPKNKKQKSEPKAQKCVTTRGAEVDAVKSDSKRPDAVSPETKAAHEKA